MDVKHIVNNIKLDANKFEYVVDIGGSYGLLATVLLRRFPKARCIVLDRKEIVSSAIVPADLEERLSFREYDIFCCQP